MKSMQKLGKEHLDCKKSTMAKSQWSNLVKVNSQHQKSTANGVVNEWRQQNKRWRQDNVSSNLEDEIS